MILVFEPRLAEHKTNALPAVLLLQPQIGSLVSSPDDLIAVLWHGRGMAQPSCQSILPVSWHATPLSVHPLSQSGASYEETQRSGATPDKL